MWDLPGPRIEPMSPALSGGFLPSAPRGSPLLYLVSWHSTIRKSISLLPCLFMYIYIIDESSWILILVNRLKFIAVWLKFIAVLIYFDTRIVRIWPVGAPSVWFHALSTQSHHFLQHVLIFCHVSDSPTFLLPWKEPFLQRTLVPFTGEWVLEIRIWVNTF